MVSIWRSIARCLSGDRFMGAPSGKIRLFVIVSEHPTVGNTDRAGAGALPVIDVAVNSALPLGRAGSVAPWFGRCNMTWSIIARDAHSGRIGIAVATRFFAVGAVV